MTDQRTPSDPPDITEVVLASATRLLGNARHDKLPDQGIPDQEIADDTGADLEVVRASLELLGQDRLVVEEDLTGPWTVHGLRE